MDFAAAKVLMSQPNGNHSVVSLLPQDKSSPKRVRTSSSILLITGLPPKAPTNRLSVSRIVDRALACTQAGQRSFTESGSNQIYSNIL
jgi:hypothetical protein